MHASKRRLACSRNTRLVLTLMLMSTLVGCGLLERKRVEVPLVRLIQADCPKPPKVTLIDPMPLGWFQSRLLMILESSPDKRTESTLNSQSAKE